MKEISNTMDDNHEHYWGKCPICPYDSEIHLPCDSNCLSLKKPLILEDALKTIEHYQNLHGIIEP
jgi:hypothetical protein